MIYYGAYGSNMSISQMEIRCPKAKLLDKGILEGYELTFRGRLNNAHATIQRSAKKNLLCGVPIVIWEISKSDEANLDRYEGYPYYYHKEYHEVTLKEGKKLVMLYVMNSGYNYNLPSPMYCCTIGDGYTEHRYDIHYLINSIEKVRKLKMEC